MPLRLLCSVLALVSIARAGQFDEPVFKKTVDLGPARYSPGAHAKVTCYFFHAFMIKEIDLGEKGAERLAIVPGAKNKMHTCSRMREDGEKDINPDDWTGYFKGVRGSLVFFDADDGVNGGMGFAVFDAKTGKKLWDDVALGDLEIDGNADKEVFLRYTRVVDGGCIIPKEQSACWEKIKSKFSLGDANAPDCKAGYEKSALDMAKGRCQAQSNDSETCLDKELLLARQQANESPSVVSYAVKVSLTAQPAVEPTGGEVRCWPAD